MYTELIQSDETDAFARWNRGVAREALGATEASAADFEKAKRLDPTLDK